MKSNPAKTVLVITVGFCVVYIITDIKLFLIISLSIGVAGILSDKLALLIEFLWMKLAYVLGLIIPNILLSLIFYLFLFPIALLSRIGNKNALFLKNNRSSIFIDRDRDYTPEQFEKSW